MFGWHRDKDTLSLSRARIAYAATKAIGRVQWRLVSAGGGKGEDEPVVFTFGLLQFREEMVRVRFILKGQI
jgi:hypothetical protein